MSSMKSTTSTETKDVTSVTSSDSIAITKKLTSVLGELYLSTRERLPLPSSAVKRLEDIEKLVEGHTSKIVDVIDTKLSEKVSEIQVRADTLKDQYVVPTSKTLLDKSSQMLNYVLPSESDDEEADDDASPLKLAQTLADKTTKRIRKRVASVTEHITAKKEEIVQTFTEKKDAIMEKQQEIVKYGLSLVAYSKGMIGKAGKIDLKRVADEVSQPYRKQAGALIVAVSDYGEYFMESVKTYESNSGVKIASPPAGKLNKMVSEIASKFVEPTLVRTVAIFFVVGDEMKKIKTMHLEPKIKDAKAKIDMVASDVTTVVSKKSAELTALILAKRSELSQLRSKIVAKINEFDFKTAEADLKKKFFELAEKIHFNETIQSLRVKLVENMKKYDLEKYEETVTQVVKKVHETIVEWVSSKKTDVAVPEKED